MKKLLLFILCPMFLFGQTQIGNDIDGESEGDFLGGSVSLSSDGNIVAIGAEFNDGSGSFSGHVRVYKKDGGVWIQIGKDIDGEAVGDNLGSSVCLSSDGSVLAIGAKYNDGNGINSGHVRVYKNNNEIWEQIGTDINGEAEGDNSGYSVSLSSDGTIVAIGAINYDFGNSSNNGLNSGHVRIYKNNDGVWEQIGSSIDGEAAADDSGFSVSLSSDGSIVAIGAPGNKGNGSSSGHVRIYKNNDGIWEQIGTDINGEASQDYSGSSVSLSSDGSIVAIGAPGNDSRYGHVRVYKNNNEVWEQIGTDINGEAQGDNSGSSVSLSSDGSIVAIGATDNDGNGSSSGHIRIYKNNNGVWEQIGTDINGEFSGDSSGISVNLSSDGNIIAIGAPLNSENGSNSGHVRVYDLSAILSSDTYVFSKFDLYPNPTKYSFTIDIEDNLEVEKVSIYNNLGQFIKSTKELTINTTNLNTGIYFVEIETTNGKATKKLIVE